MTAVTAALPVPSPLIRHRLTLLALLHVPFAASATVLLALREHDLSSLEWGAVVSAAGGALALQLRHSLATARQVRPRAWPASLSALCVLTYGPLAWIGPELGFTQHWFVMASTAMLLRGPVRVVAVALPLAGWALFMVIASIEMGLHWWVTLNSTAFVVLGLCVGGVALYASARLANVVEELYAARTELADAAVRRERLRVSRDLHDLLGHSLSAVALRGDLALRLLGSDPSAARREIDGLTEVARVARRDLRAVVRDERAASLTEECTSAEDVLSAAGIRTTVILDVDALDASAATVLAWAVREGATNVLRHSDAAVCSITVTRSDGVARLEIVNDGVREQFGVGSGLGGLRDRARALSGAVSGGPTGHDRFRLTVDVPEERL